MSRLEARQWQTMLAQSWSPRQWYDDEQRPDEADNLVPEEQRIMWVYRKTEPNNWTVGYWTPDKEWVAESDWSTSQDAARRVRWLNGRNN